MKSADTTDATSNHRPDSKCRFPRAASTTSLAKKLDPETSLRSTNPTTKLGNRKTEIHPMTNMKPPTTTTEDSKPPASAMASTSTQTQNANNGCGSSRMNHPPSYAGTPNGSSNNGSSSNSAAASPGCFIKPSLSLNSLPPQVPPEGSEMAQNRLRIDRPYNSLKVSEDTIHLTTLTPIKKSNFF